MFEFQINLDDMEKTQSGAPSRSPSAQNQDLPQMDPELMKDRSLAPLHIVLVLKKFTFSILHVVIDHGDEND